MKSVGVYKIYISKKVNALANIQPVIKIELNPYQPVPEICAVINAVSSYHQGQEESLLIGIKEAINQRLEHLKGVTKPNGNK